MADAEPVYRAGVVTILESAGFTARPIEVAALDDRPPGSRVVVLDAALGDAPYARDLVAGLAGSAFPPEVVVVVGRIRAEGLLAVIDAGASALVHRWCEPDELLAAVRAALAGQDVVAAPLAVLLREEARAEGGGGASRSLSAREHEVLRRMATGASNAAIGHSLGISEHTVRNHVRAILAKLGVANRTDAVTTALRRGIVDLTG